MPRTKTITLKNKKPKRRITSKDRSISRASRRGKSDSHSTKSSKKPFFVRINSWLNHLSTAQFITVLLSIVIVSLVLYKPVTAFVGSNDILGTVITEIGDTGPDCDALINKLNTECWDVIPELKQTGNYTNALLLGIDTREGDSGLMNTDTIIVASFDHTTGDTLLISFPRDLYVPTVVNGKSGGNVKINSLYAIGEQRSDTDGLSLISENIEHWLNLDIHYTAMVNFRAVTTIVDELGGVDITLDDTYVDIYPYKELSTERQQECIRAKDYGLYCVFTFQEGTHTLDGEEALIYARMRQYTSDFDRARRQQEIIDSIKEKLLGDEQNLFEKATDGWNIYQSMVEDGYLKADLEYSDMIAGLFLVAGGDINLDPVSIVLDPSFGNGKYMFPGMVGVDEETGEGGIYVLNIRGNSFTQVAEEIDRIRDYAPLYQDKASVVLSNRTGEKFPMDSLARQMYDEKPYFESFFSITGTTEPESTGINILVFNHDKTITAEYIKDYFSELDPQVLYVVESDGFEQSSSYLEDIRIEIHDQINPGTTPEPTESASELDT
ncbi:LCP family protein [Candidatus Dojkabacteria bacterium]|uniref:LCP family protein n=1 Tax=Candidatus Dojkabacteria bacterium TaxID=2099670 RepID=A0A955L8Z2_9BACT|nr:LCP family protein [Candidatus Dojkabacteria bacterium]